MAQDTTTWHHKAGTLKSVTG